MGSIVDQIRIGDVIFLDSILDFSGWVNVVIAWGWDLWFEVLDVLIVGDLPFLVDVHGGSSLSIEFNMGGVLHRVGHDDVVRVDSILPVRNNHVVLSSNPIVLHAKITQGGMVHLTTDVVETITEFEFMTIWIKQLEVDPSFRGATFWEISWVDSLKGEEHCLVLGVLDLNAFSLGGLGD